MADAHLALLQLRQLDGDVEMRDDAADGSNGSSSPSVDEPELESPQQTARLARFKADQDLKIQTENLAGETAPPGVEEAKETKEPVPPPTPTPTPTPTPSSGKKRRRRTAAQIDRKHCCNYPGCTKAYGSEGSLTQHQRLKHRQAQEESLATTRKSQLGKLFLPLHRSPSGQFKAGTYLPPSAPTSTRTVTIRPATMGAPTFDVTPPGPMDGGPLLAPDLLAPGESSSLAENILSGHAAAVEAQHRTNLRSRSNSMPISFSTLSPVQTQRSVGSTGGSRRKSRASGTPRPKSTTSRRAKSRSKSESLTGLGALNVLDNLQLPPRSDRSISDSTASAHDSVLPLHAANADMNASSWSLEDVAMLMDEQAIDSDILSVLADCDPSDLGDASSIHVSSGPPSTTASSFQASPFAQLEDQEMLPVGLECFNMAGVAPAGSPSTADGDSKRENFSDGFDDDSHEHDLCNVEDDGGGPVLPMSADIAQDNHGMKGSPTLRLGAFNSASSVSNAFGLGSFAVDKSENDGNALSQINTLGGIADNPSSVHSLNSIVHFHDDAMNTTAGLPDPGTPLHGIPTKLEKLNIDNNACWRDVASLLAEPEDEDLPPRQHNQEAHESLSWMKEPANDPALSLAADPNSPRLADLTPIAATTEMDWRTTKLSTTSAGFFQPIQVPSSRPTHQTFGEMLMSDVGDFGVLDTRIPSHALSREEDFL